jgi:threonine dehydrogenase-like Zn-dependent dehydrogenase
MTVIPGKPGSAEVSEVPDPPVSDGSVLVEAISVGICGTDREIVEGGHGAPPPGRERLLIGHESLGRVVSAPDDAGVAVGDTVMGVVRRPDPVPCERCAAGEWDFCRNGRYTERGVEGRDGYGAEYWRIEPEFAVRVDPALGVHGVLVEPASVVAKAWEEIDRFRARSSVPGNRALITGAGPIGLLAALLGVQRGLDVHVLDQVTSGAKPDLVAALGATYHHGDVADLGLAPDVAVECTGVGSVAFGVARASAPGSVICLAGLSAGHGTAPVDLDTLAKDLVMANTVLFGTVNAALRNYAQAAEALAAADQAWLERLITRRVPLSSWPDALDRRADDVKVVVDLRD